MVNFNQLLKQAQEMQSKLQEEQASLNSVEYEGKSGGGLALVKVTGRGELKSLSIDKSIINPEEKEILEDLIIAAYNDAKSKSDAASKESMSDMFGRLNLPPGFKLPF